MAMAKLPEQRSKDPNSQVGACIVSQDNKILSIGYNGAPNGFNDDVLIPDMSTLYFAIIKLLSSL